MNKKFQNNLELEYEDRPLPEEGVEDTEFDASFDEELEEDAQQTVKNFPSADDLALELKEIFSEVERERRDIELEWIKDLRQFKGKYSDEVLQNMDANRSKAFIRLTRTKVKTVDSRLLDFLFPANGDRNWSVQQTPVPELAPEKMQEMVNSYQQQTQQQITPEELVQLVEEQAKHSAELMEKEIEDQLLSLRYREILRNVLHSGNLYGTGILKGPLVNVKTNKRYIQDETGEWVLLEFESVLPFIESVSIWDFYPDLTVDRLEDTRYIFQRHVMDKAKVMQLADRNDFNSEKIHKYITEAHDGDLEYKDHELELQELGNVTSQRLRRDNSKKFEILEYWGYIDADQLEKLGVDIPANKEHHHELKANIWILGNNIIKAVLMPIEGTHWPYYAYYYDKDETSIFGEGIASIMRDVQELLNAGFRAMLDNAAISAGPQIEVNLDLLDPSEDPTEIYPFKTWLRTGQGAEAQYPAIKVHTLPSYTNEFIGMCDLFERYCDEVTTIPRYMYGDPSGQGAQRTASGLSMLMGNSNITMKDQVKNFDDGITKPFIKALYFWNMEFNNKQEIKGDYDVKAEGVTSLIAKEVFTERLIQFAQMTANPLDKDVTKRDNIIREIAKALDIDNKDIVKDEKTYTLEQKQQAEQEGQRRQFMNMVIEEARKYGVSPDALMQNLNDQYERQLQLQQMAQGGGMGNENA